MKRKKILILTSRFPYPIIGGDKLRIYQICRQLSERYRLTLLSLCETKDDLYYETPNDGVFENIERIFLPRWKSYLNTLCALPTKTPLQIAYYRSKSFKEAIDRLLPSHNGVLAHLIRCGNYVSDVEIPKILEMTDAISLNYNRVKNFSNSAGFKGLIYRIEANRLLEYERSVVTNFDLSVLVSPTDKNFLFGNEEQDNVLVCSNGVDLNGLPFSLPVLESKLIVFIGNMRTLQNLDACYYFCENILPLLRQRNNYRFRIVGSISEELKVKFLNYEGVEVTGRIENIADAVMDASIGVCPMRIGAGVQNKVLEYMALGLPSITTTLGYEGIHAQPNKELLIADSPQEFVLQVEKLISDSHYANAMATHARAFVEQQHEWSSMLKPLLDRVVNIV